MPEQFWADDFDMDLPKVLPDLDIILGDLAEVRLWTYGHTTYGRLNNPSMWNSHSGMVAYFGLDDSGKWKPADHHTFEGLVECTWREVVRDVWTHQCVVIVNYHPVWNTIQLQRVFDDLMHHRRGWKTLPEGRASDLIGRVARDVDRATTRLRAIGGGRRG